MIIRIRQVLDIILLRHARRNFRHFITFIYFPTSNFIIYENIKNIMKSNGFYLSLLLPHTFQLF